MADESTSTETSDASGAGGGVPAGFVPQAALDAAEAKRRDLQSQLDKLRAAPAPAAPAPTPTSPASSGESELAQTVAALAAKLEGFDPTGIGRQVQAEIARAQAIADARTALKSEFANARPEVLAADYATPEEMRLAVEASHTTEAANIAAVEARVREQIAAQMKELHGIDLAPAPQTPATSESLESTGPLTQRDLAAMSVEQLSKLSEADIEKALART